MGTKDKFVPVMMRDDSGEVVKLCDAHFNPDRGTFRFRVDLDTLRGEHAIFGQALEMGLVEGLHIRVLASDFGIQAIEAQEPAVEETVEQS